MSLIGAMQHRHLALLQSIQPKRPLLVQPLTGNKETRWVGIDAVPPGSELWTRSILLNEVLFDADVRPWGNVARAMARLLEAADSMQAPYYAGPSGGKGAHASLYLDPESIRGPDRLLERASLLGVDLWSEARLAVADAVLDQAGFPSSDAERWAPPIGSSGVWDRSKIKWSAARSGSMVRLLGTPGSTGARKTLASEAWTPDHWLATAERDSPPQLPVRFHDTIQLYKVPDEIVGTILARVEAACDALEAARIKARPKANALAALAKLKAVPCVARILETGAPRGTRHYAFLNLSVTAHYLGVPRAAAEGLLRKALANAGLPDTDPAMQTLHEVYDGRYSLLNISCPSPHVQAWCQPTACPLSRGLSFGCR